MLSTGEKVKCFEVSYVRCTRQIMPYLLFGGVFVFSSFFFRGLISTGSENDLDFEPAIYFEAFAALLICFIFVSCLFFASCRFYSISLDERRVSGRNSQFKRSEIQLESIVDVSQRKVGIFEYTEVTSVMEDSLTTLTILKPIRDYESLVSYLQTWVQPYEK